MSYFTFKEKLFMGFPEGYDNCRVLKNGDTLRGMVKDVPTSLRVVEDKKDAVLKNGTLVQGEEGATCFDRTGRIFGERVMVVHLDSLQSHKVTSLQESEERRSGYPFFSNRFGDVCEQLARQAKEQAGLRPKGRRSLSDRLTDSIIPNELRI